MRSSYFKCKPQIRFSNLGLVFIALAVCAATVLTLSVLAGTTPSSGTLSPSNPSISFSGGPFAVSNPSSPTGDNPPACVDATCGVFALTVDIPPTDFNSYKAKLHVEWTNSGTTTLRSTKSDYDVYVYSPNLTGTQTAKAASADNPEETSFDVASGNYTIYVDPFDVSPTVPFNATLTLIRVTQTPWPATEGPTAVPPGTPRFFNYFAPSGVADDAGEPSIGVNWNTEKVFNGIPNGGTVNYFGGFLPYMLRVTFDDSASPANATWEQAPLTIANAPRVFGDPILFTDHETGRTFVSQLIGLTPLGSTTEITDNDGHSFLPSEGSGLPSNIDHQTFGGGPYHAPIPSGANPLYKNAVYYCSQSVAEAGCSLSIDGGLTFGPFVPIYTSADCAGLHGHVKVAADGTVYIPNKGCGGDPDNPGSELDDPLFHANGRNAVVVSEDNGTTWDVRKIPTADTASDRDPSVAVATDGTLYFAYKAKNGHSRVAVSPDKGLTWINDTDVGAQLGIQTSVFQAAVAGDPNRAAVAFFGTTTPGNNWDQPDFPGVWYLYIATTFDGGVTWTTQNATPGDPIQRGGICGDGACRNLLDFFDATIDKEGRVLVGYDDGCISSNCISGERSYGLIAPNDFTAKAVIARQASGLRMFSQYDGMAGPDINPTGPPPPPPHATSCDGNVVTDAAGDAVHPLLSSNGGNTDQVDITGLSFGLSADEQSLVSTITLKNFSTTPITGAVGTFYYATWTSARKNDDGSVATRTYATRAATDATGAVTYRFGQYDQANDAFVGTSTVVTGSNTPGPGGNVKVIVPLSLLGNPTIPVTDLTTFPVVIEPYALTIIHEQAVRFVQSADRAPNAGASGANWKVCPAPPPPECIEDNDGRISYSEGWHTVNSTIASGGHFRLHSGKSPSHSASLTFTVAAGSTGKLTYYYGTSTKGGSADVSLGGVSKTISYKGSTGSLKDPVFGSKEVFANLAPGQYKLEIKNMSDGVYVDRFCLESSNSSSQSASGPGQTSSNSSNLNAGQDASSSVPIGTGATAISVVAEASGNLPIKLLLINPSGSILQTADSSDGVAVISAPVSQSGTYIVKVVNLSLGPVQVWTAATPTVSR